MRDSTGLGYATTIHAAQGVTADTMHGLVTGQESRQQLYTMLTRGRPANHLYLQVVGDGDPHTVIRPETVAPRTPTEILEQILARDDSPHLSHHPAARTQRPGGPAVRRPSSATPTACTSPPNSSSDPGPSQTLDRRADQVVPGVTDEPAWPTLRADLIALAAETGEHPLVHLHQAALGRDLSTAGDMAAVLDWRLPEPAPTDPGPLPWLPGIPQALHDHPDWGDYLAQRSQLIADLADEVRDHAFQATAQPAWAPPGSHPSAALIGEIAVWRAANGIDPHDHSTHRSSTTADRFRPLATPPRSKCCPVHRRQHRSLDIQPRQAGRKPARRSTPPAPTTRGPPELDHPAPAF